MSNKVQREYLDDQTWAIEHYLELQKDYPEMWVAIDNKSVIAADLDGSKVKKAIRNLGKEVPLIYLGGADVIY